MGYSHCSYIDTFLAGDRARTSLQRMDYYPSYYVVDIHFLWAAVDCCLYSGRPCAVASTADGLGWLPLQRVIWDGCPYSGRPGMAASTADGPLLPLRCSLCSCRRGSFGYICRSLYMIHNRRNCSARIYTCEVPSGDSVHGGFRADYDLRHAG